MTRTSPLLTVFCLFLAVTFCALGAEIPASDAPASPDTTVVEACQVIPHLLTRREEGLFHLAVANIRHAGAPAEMVIEVPGCEAQRQPIDEQTASVEFGIPACERATRVPVTFVIGGKKLKEETVVLSPARRLEIFLLPHSHVDIGYTKLQTEVERDHWGFLEQAVDMAAQGEDRSPEAQFKWNAEVLWAVDSYLRRAAPERAAALAAAIKEGAIGLDAFYCHELAGLCRPEELLQAVACARRMRRELGVAIEAAMVTDCPGLTWGAVPALALSGVKYLSLGPNSGHRIGYTREAQDNKPFYWVSPSGEHKVLCWQTSNSYHPSFSNGEELRAFLKEMSEDESRYPYDILHFRQCRGDNRGPDAALPAFVEEWNRRHASPRLVIATTAEAFRAFEARYGASLPSLKGDFSPYWEDGAASSARETAVNRATAERLVQAAALWAMLRRDALPREAFDEAWRNVLLYDEHTWGARSYVNSRNSYPPGSPGYKAQWAIKQAFALDAEVQSRELLARAAESHRTAAGTIAAVDVFNTLSWARSDLVVLPAGMKVRGECVRDAAGRELPSQRLASGELAVLVREVPAFGASRLTFHEGSPNSPGRAMATEAGLSNGLLRVAIDEQTGAIRELRWEAAGVDLAAAGEGGLNTFHYVPGFDPEDALTNGRAAVTVKDRGPLVASIVVASDTPGCQGLSREIRVVDGLNRVDIINILDKKAIPLEDLLKEQPQKEGYHFGFAFDVPNGEVRLDMPWAVVRPEKDQIPGSCKNWFSVQRWADVSNEDYGVTWSTVDAPLVEVGAMSAQPRIPSAKEIWRKTIEPAQTLFSYVMNNYWTTNYRHDQEGPVTFRYAITPHMQFDTAAAARFGVACSQPLLAVPVDAGAPLPRPALDMTPSDVIATSLKPAANGADRLVRLFGASEQTQRVGFTLGNGVSAEVWRTDLDGEPLERAHLPIEVKPWEIVSLRLEVSR